MWQSKSTGPLERPPSISAPSPRARCWSAVRNPETTACHFYKFRPLCIFPEFPQGSTPHVQVGGRAQPATRAGFAWGCVSECATDFRLILGGLRPFAGSDPQGPGFVGGPQKWSVPFKNRNKAHYCQGTPAVRPGKTGKAHRVTGKCIYIYTGQVYASPAATLESQHYLEARVAFPMRQHCPCLGLRGFRVTVWHGIALDAA